MDELSDTLQGMEVANSLNGKPQLYIWENG
jgi:hypothetical protein